MATSTKLIKLKHFVKRMQLYIFREQQSASTTEEYDNVRKDSSQYITTIDNIFQATRLYCPFQRILTFAMCVINSPGCLAIYLTSHKMWVGTVQQM